MADSRYCRVCGGNLDETRAADGLCCLHGRLEGETHADYVTRLQAEVARLREELRREREYKTFYVGAVYPDVFSQARRWGT